MQPVRPATATDVDRLSATLARAFDDDPIMTWAMPDTERRQRGLLKIFDRYLRTIYLPDRHSYTVDVDGGVGGGALWAPPGKPRPGIRDLLRQAPLLPVLGRRIGMLRLLAELDKRHPYDAPHFYLAVLGTEPALQGKGYGSALLAPVLEQCDREGIPAYLESSKERNVPFYARHGWKVTGEIRVPRSDKRLGTMWREPRA
jgi:GNAT superfamily N-acetyltransferase